MRPAIVALLIICICQLTGFTAAQQAPQCTSTINSCSCHTDTGIVDLSPLKGQNGQPRFQNICSKPGADGFSFNPCGDFTEGTGGCNSVAACQIHGLSTGRPEYHSLGSQASATFINDPSHGIELQYTDTDSAGVKRTLNVRLNCEEDIEGEFFVSSVDPSKPEFYQATLTSKYACSKNPMSLKNSVSVANFTTMTTMNVTNTTSNITMTTKNVTMVMPNVTMTTKNVTMTTVTINVTMTTLNVTKATYTSTIVTSNTTSPSTPTDTSSTQPQLPTSTTEKSDSDKVVITALIVGGAVLVAIICSITICCVIRILCKRRDPERVQLIPNRPWNDSRTA